MVHWDCCPRLEGFPSDGDVGGHCPGQLNPAQNGTDNNTVGLPTIQPALVEQGRKGPGFKKVQMVSENGEVLCSLERRSPPAEYAH